MIDPQQAQIVVARGRQATALLTSEVFVEAMRDLENYHVTAMVSCRPGPSERETRDHHHLMLFALGEVTTQLVGYAAAGTETEAHLAHSETDTNEDI